ncbi:MAG: hypothetical protein QOE31_94 [Solirubrobacteraceae bacterium]|jgi:hypothetical protein|nr:hypothetical protein [Solirubrobacteraceae bacterium]
MSYALERLIDRFAQRAAAAAPIEVAAPREHAVVIRLARDDDLPALHDLAELDSAEPLAGAALVAIVDGRPWAAAGIDDDRVVADPFHPSAEAAGLLRLRVRQLRAAGSRAQPRGRRRRRRVTGRAGAS